MGHKVLNGINVACIMLAIISSLLGIVITDYYVMPIIVLVSSFLGVFSLARAESHFSLAKILISIYYLIEVTIQGAFSMFWPNMIIGANYNKYYGAWLFRDSRTILMHFFWATAFLCLANILLSIEENVTIVLSANGSGKSFREERKGPCELVKYPFILLILSATIKSYIGYTTLSRNGYVEYFLSGVQVFCLGCTVISCIRTKIDSWSLIKILFAVSIYAVPGLLKGRRIFVIQATLTVVIFILVLEPHRLWELMKRRKILFGIIGVSILFVFGLTNLEKFGVFNPVGLLVRRIIGLFDSCVVMKYMESSNVQLSFSNYWKCVVNDSGIRANVYYTYYVMNFPVGRANGFAAPIYAVSRFYGVGGWLWINSFLILIFGTIAKKAEDVYKKIFSDQGSKNEVYMYYLFICCFSLVLVIQKHFLDGNIEILKDFSIPIVALVLTVVMERIKTTQR